MKRKRTMNGLTPGHSRWILFTVWLACLTPVVGWADALSLPRLYTPESRLTPPDVHPGVYGKLYRPAASGPAPAVVILHGRSGIFPDYRQLAQTLSTQGYMALVLNYNMESGGCRQGMRPDARASADFRTDRPIQHPLSARATGRRR